MNPQTISNNLRMDHSLLYCKYCLHAFNVQYCRSTCLSIPEPKKSYYKSYLNAKKEFKIEGGWIVDTVVNKTFLN